MSAKYGQGGVEAGGTGPGKVTVDTEELQNCEV